MSTIRLLSLCWLTLLASAQARANGIAANRTVAGYIADEVSSALIERSGRRSAISRVDTTTALKRRATSKACEIDVGATVVVVDSAESLIYRADASKAQSLGLESWEKSRLLLDGTVGTVVSKYGDIVGFRADATGYEYVVGIHGVAYPACLHVGDRYGDSWGKDITVEATLQRKGGYSVIFLYGGVNKTGTLHSNTFQVPWWQRGTVVDDGNVIFDDGGTWIKKEPPTVIWRFISSWQAKVIGVLAFVVIILAILRDSIQHFFAGCCNCFEGSIPSSQSKLNVKVRNLNGDIFELQLLGSQYVEGVKDMIHKKDGEEIEKFFIETDQWYLRENNGITMDLAEVKDGDTIYMKPTRTGASKPKLELSETQKRTMTSRQKRLQEAAQQQSG